MLFCDQPDAVRDAVRDAVFVHGGYVDGYDGPGVQILLPREGWVQLEAALAALGLHERPGSRFLFPARTGWPESLKFWKDPADRNSSAAYNRYVTFDL